MKSELSYGYLVDAFDALCRQEGNKRPGNGVLLSMFSELAAASRAYIELGRTDRLGEFLSENGSAYLGKWDPDEYTEVVAEYVMVKTMKSEWSSIVDYLPILVSNRVFFVVGDAGGMKGEVRSFGGFPAKERPAGLAALTYPVRSLDDGFGFDLSFDRIAHVGHADDRYLAAEEAEWLSRNFPQRRCWRYLG